MDELLPVERREILEERANRDAFRICLALIALMLVALIVAGIVAWNVRVILYPLMPRESRAPAQKTLSFLPGHKASAWDNGSMSVPTPAGGFRDFPSRRVQFA